MEDIKLMYKEIKSLESIVNDLQLKIRDKYTMLTTMEEEYYSSIRKCYACKKELTPQDTDIYCDYCLNGDTETDE